VSTGHIIVALRCHYCGKGRNPHEIINIGTGGAIMCWHCYGWHLEAVRFLTHGTLPRGCQECGKPFEELRNPGPNGDSRLYVTFKDRLYQILCGPCHDRYVTKRVDFYKDTAYGHALKL
jgi:hypothetical protein